MDAQRALNSFVTRLTAFLANEAQLPGRVRRDVEFIRDEMEGMESLFSQHTGAEHLWWMKQLVRLTEDCKDNVELYVDYMRSEPGDDGLLGFLRRISWFLRTIRRLQGIATRFRELKDRARDISERRQRYGLPLPASAMTNVGVVDIEFSQHTRFCAPGHGRRRRRCLVTRRCPSVVTNKDVVRRGTDALAKILCSEPATPEVRVFSIVGVRLAVEVAKTVYIEDSSVSSRFDCKAWSKYDGGDAGRVFANILEQVRGVQLEPGQEEDDEVTNQSAGTTSDKDMEMRLIREIQGHLEGKCFLILIDVWASISEWKPILDALLKAPVGFLPGSTILIITKDYDLALSSSHKIINASYPKYDTAYGFYFHQTKQLSWQRKAYLSRDTFRVFKSETFALKMFVHLLDVNPDRTEVEMQNYEYDIFECTQSKRSISKQVLQWCYKDLPSKYKSCLLYLTVFPEGHIIRTRSLARRWAAEGLITSTTTSTPTDDETQSSSTDEAERCLDVLWTRGFLSPMEVGAAGNIKSCTVHRQVQEFIAEEADKDVDFTDSNLPSQLARYTTGLQNSFSDGDSKDIAAYLLYLSESGRWRTLKVLELEGRIGLDKKKHMKRICKLPLLKYLSLRNTDVTELPKQIKELQHLETLDIRQTKVRVFSKKAIVLPHLKHFLAGNKISISNDARKSEESILAVDVPLGKIHIMNKLEILSHVQVTNSSSELTGIAKLLKLRKLGVALRGRNAKLSDLFHQIEKLHLRSLTVQIDEPAASENHGDLTPPRFIKSLNISGLTSGLPHLIQQLDHLAKLTLAEARLNEDDLRILGSLRDLRCLRLLHQSYIRSELTFEKEEFQALEFLLVGTSDVTKISFATGAAPKLERIVWSFPTPVCVSGLSHLPLLREFVHNGESYEYAA